MTGLSQHLDVEDRSSWLLTGLVVDLNANDVDGSTWLLGIFHPNNY